MAREGLCLASDFLCFHMYLLLQRFCSWVKSEKCQPWKIFCLVLSGCFFAPVDRNYILNVYIVNDSFAVTIRKSQWYIAHPDPICISTSSFPWFCQRCRNRVPKVTQQWPPATSVLLGLLGTKALLSINGLLRRGKKPARVMVGNCKTWSTSGHQ